MPNPTDYERGARDMRERAVREISLSRDSCDLARERETHGGTRIAMEAIAGILDLVARTVAGLPTDPNETERGGGDGE